MSSEEVRLQSAISVKEGNVPHQPHKDACETDGCCAACASQEHAHAHKEDTCEADGCTACASCGHSHEHGEEAEEPWKLWLPIALGAALFVGGFFAEGPIHIVLNLVAYVLLGAPVLLQAGKDILRGQVFGESFLMGIATIGALGLGDYDEAVAVMLFYRVGEYFQDLAVGRSRKSIRAAVGLRPDTARVMREGAWQVVDPAAVSVGEQVLINPGERIPLDGEILSGESLVDFSALTGEAVPVRVALGREVMAGGINQSSPITVRVVRPASESAVSRVLRAVEDAAKGKPKLENFITRFARVYTPIVVAIAALLAVIPPLAGLGAFSEWLHRALIFLVISCPCALVISVPLTFFAGLANASSRGVLFKGANRMEQLAAVQAAVFDKTGTLTHGVFKVQMAIPVNWVTEEELLKFAAAAEHFSPHPVASAIRAAAGEYAPAEEAEEIAGRGVSASTAGRRVLVGNARLMQEHGITNFPASTGTVAYVAVDGSFKGTILIADELKADAGGAIKKLNGMIGYTAILTGDAEAPAQEVANQTGVNGVYYKQLPEDKLTRMQEIRGMHGSVLFVGDGINDAPVLMGADVGMAIGGSGTDMAVEAADVVLLTPELTAIPDSISVSRRTMAIAKMNIAFAIAIKVLVMILGAFGIASMWMAVFADVGTTLICVVNALRLLPVRRK